MRMVNIDDYNEKTMQLAKPVQDEKRRVLLGAGSTIHEKYLSKLKELGIRYLFIEDAKSKGISLDEMMDMPTWMDIIAVVEKTFKDVKENNPLPMIELNKSVKRLTEEVSRNKAIILIPTTTVSASLKPFAHMVNVTLLALQIGKKLGYNGLQLHDLAFGCLLHDIGKAKTDNREEHPETGFNIIRANREISLISAHVAYQHHETLDGKGFPRKIEGKDVLEFAQICSIANDYENAISNEALSPDEAIEKIMTYSNRKYTHDIVLAFHRGIISYPPGTNVKLNIGDGIVTKVIDNPHRPVVRVHKVGKEVSLNQQPTIMIEKVLPEETNEIK
ncbi:HD domain-containing protein [Bacillus shivajii]|uniref:HD-GYP domain-containing protein n=1 Tax=Bacillus shivajii TaxID=1983719 RepID=UPI001CF9EB90|nr:HD domain-containing phosphohydrolase [Bacillus shivajii]UCZ52870.1 HD domain-containing protein [Bacillus shivajii]